MSGSRALFLVAGFCLAVQVLSATLQVRDLDTMHTVVARNLVHGGKLSVAGWRAYVLPGESLYLAPGFFLLPKPFWRYLHVPVVVLLVTSVAAIALTIGGPSVALAAGLVASLDPFMVVHGPVWDDAFLAAALEWFIFASLVVTLSQKTADGRARCGVPLVVLALAAGLAAVTRTQSQIVLGSIVAATVWLARLRPIRPMGWAILVGMVLAVGAWGTRSYLVLGSFDVGSSHDGKTLFESNCSYTREGIRTLGVVGGFLDKCSAAQVGHVVTLDELEADRQFRRYALAYIASNPGDVATTAGFKLLVSLSGFDFRTRAVSLRNVGAVGSSLLMLTVGAYGLWQLWNRAPRPPHLIAFFIMCGATSITTLVMLLIGPTGLRYRIGVAGFLFLGAGAMVVQAFFWTRNRVDLQLALGQRR